MIDFIQEKYDDTLDRLVDAVNELIRTQAARPFSLRNYDAAFENLKTERGVFHEAQSQLHERNSKK